MTPDKGKIFEQLCEKVLAETMRNGGSTGSNLAEPLYFSPGPAVIPDNLPPEEKARRIKAAAGIREMVHLAGIHADEKQMAEASAKSGNLKP